MKIILFDLDGTLINSENSIICSIKKIFNNNEIEPKKAISNELIGPPIYDLIFSLLPDENNKLVDKFVEEFKEEYDNFGCINTNAFEGISEMLELLKRKGYNLSLATNKRMRPTLKIIEYLSWRKYFDDIYTIDGFGKTLKNKTEILLRAKNKDYIEYYIGDREEDEIASRNALIPFIFVNWGYGSNPDSNCCCVDNPQQLLERILYQIK